MVADMTQALLPIQDLCLLPALGAYWLLFRLLRYKGRNGIDNNPVYTDHPV